MLSCAETLNTEFGWSYLVNLKGRDPQTEAHFAAYFSHYLDRKLRGQLRSADLADDIRQETLVRVLETVYANKDLEHPERFAAFVDSVCNNVLLEHWRRRKTAGETLELAEQVDHRPDPEGVALAAQEIAELRKVLVKLHKRDRDLLRMIYWEERDHDEVSRMSQTSADHVRVMLHRAKRAVRRYLNEYQTFNPEKIKKSAVLRDGCRTSVTT